MSSSAEPAFDQLAKAVFDRWFQEPKDDPIEVVKALVITTRMPDRFSAALRCRYGLDGGGLRQYDEVARCLGVPKHQAVYSVNQAIHRLRDAYEARPVYVIRSNDQGNTCPNYCPFCAHPLPHDDPQTLDPHQSLDGDLANYVCRRCGNDFWVR